MFGIGKEGALATAQDLWDTPRQAVYKGLDSLANALGGDPNHPWEHGKDILTSAGMDPDSTLTKGLGMGVDLLTDPMSYALPLAAGYGVKAAGRGLEAAALARGPQYAGGLEKLAATGIEGSAEGQGAYQALKQAPELSQVLGELPEGSQFLGGNNGLAFRTPQGDVMRLATSSKGLPESRLDIPEMLQPTRNVEMGNYRVERTPFADAVGDADLYQEAYPQLTQSLRAQKIHPADMQPGNVGRLDGRPVLVDPGAAVPHPAALKAGQEFGRAPSMQASQPGSLMSYLLDRTGYTPEWVQGQLAQRSL